MTTLIGYARVSTTDQNLEAQLDALRAAGCARIFDEKASGAIAERPKLSAALDYLREGDVLVVTKLDRAGRSLKHLLEMVNDLERRGIGFRSLTESIDTTTPGGRLVFHLFASLAEFERDLTRERTYAGASRTEQWLDSVDPAELTPVAPQILQLREAVDARHTSEQDVEAAVRAARNAGFSWARIALVLGVSRQSAHERYAEKTPL